jgi:hypothetical protein
MEVKFDYPLSNTRTFQGELNVTATVEGRKAVIDQVIHKDPLGNKSDITYLIDEWCNNLYDNLAEMAVNNASNVNHPELEDYTMSRQ